MFGRTALMSLVARLQCTSMKRWQISRFRRVLIALLDGSPDTTLVDCYGKTAMDLSDVPTIRSMIYNDHNSKRMNFNRRKTFLMIISRVSMEKHIVDLNAEMSDPASEPLIRRVATLGDKGVIRMIMEFV